MASNPGEMTTAPVAAVAPVTAVAPSLRRNFSWTLAGNVIYAACQWGILVVLAKLLSAESVGQFVLGIAIASPVFLLANLQLGAVQATDAKRETPFTTYFRLRLLTTGLAILVLLGIVAATGYPARTAAVILVIGAAKALDALSDIFHGLYQQQEQMRLVSTSLMLNGIASLAAAAAAIWSTRDVLWGAAAFALGSAVALVCYNLPTGSAIWRSRLAGDAGPTSLWRSLLAGDWELAAPARLAMLAAPVGFAAGLVAINGALPRYFIHAHLGDRALGIFAALAYIMTAGVTFVGSLCNAAMPRMARRYAERDFAGFNRIILKVLLAACAAGLAGIAVALVAGRPILTILYRPEYAEHHAVFVWVMCAAAITYASAVLAYAVTATRAFPLLTLPYSAVTLATLVACWLLVPRYGLHGAAWALAVSGATGCAGAAWVLYLLRRKDRMRSGEM